MTRLLTAVAAAALLATAGCDARDQGEAPNGASDAASGAEVEAGGKTIAAGLDQNSRFAQAAKAVGLDATLGGSEPYTVLVPSDDAFAKASGEALANPANPANRAELTRILTNHILPGTVLIADIEKAIDAGNGKIQLPAMGGGAITAAREDGRLVLSDAAGSRAKVTTGDQRFANGVVHHIDSLLAPAEEAAGGGQGR